MTLKEAESLLRTAGIENARHEARLIFKELGGAKDHELVGRDACSDSPLVEDAVLRRAKREPLQYIIGRADFYRESYKVTPECLIPRSDTEILVDFAVKNLTRGATFLDLCSGSGCVGISVLCNTENTKCISADLSVGAVSLTEENARLNRVDERLTVKQADVLSERIEGRFSAVLSNPPYVTEAAYGELAPEIYHEPREAFLGGEDGADFYRALTPMYRDSIEDGGFIAYEIGYDQAALLETIARENGMSCEILYDLSANPRVAVLRKREQLA